MDAPKQRVILEGFASRISLDKGLNIRLGTMAKVIATTQFEVKLVMSSSGEEIRAAAAHKLIDSKERSMRRSLSL